MSDDGFAPIPEKRFAPWLLEPMRRNMGTFWKVAIAAAFINIFGLVTALFTMIVYDRVVPNNAMSSLVALSVGLLIVIVFDFILRMLRAYFMDHAGAHIDQEIGEAVFARLMAIRLELKKGSTGALTGMMRELEALRDFFASVTLTAIVDVPFIFLTLAFIAVIGGKVALVPAILVPLVILVGWATHPALDRLSSRSMNEGLLKQSVLVEAVGGMETIKASNANAFLSRRWSEAVVQHSDILLRQRLVAAIGTNFASTAGMLAYAGIVIVGVQMIGNFELTTGELIACSILGGRTIAPLAQISQLLSRLTATRTAYRQIKNIMDLPPEGPAGDGLCLNNPEGSIELRNVTFSYPGASEKTLKGISFVIQPKEHVALIGRVGSGKSTIARMVLGLYPPDEGLVMIDGVDVRQIAPDNLRQHFGAALQESVLLSGTVRENIHLERVDVDEEEVLRAARISGTHDFIGRIANGYDLRLSDRGEGLSGGQRQSISLARALAGRPTFFVMDEPTSAMDAQTEASLVQRLKTEFVDRTLIVITHRPPLLQLVDRIIMIDNGIITADGPREAVLNELSKRKAA